MGQAKLLCSNILYQVRRSLLLVAVICLPAPPPTHDVILTAPGITMAWGHSLLAGNGLACLPNKNLHPSERWWDP
ncbi:hypothetical protein V8C40DRAFT_242881 [Trichoderma camerunense]